MNNLRKLVRKLVSEAFKKVHYNDRVEDRLRSKYSTFTTGATANVQAKVFDNIAFIEDVTFPGQDNIGIILFKSTQVFKYEKELSNGEFERSIGNFIWMVIRAHELENVVFGDANYRPLNTQIHLSADYLRKYIDEVKKGNKNLTTADISRFKNGFKIPEKQPAEVPKPQEAIFIIDGVRYLASQEKQLLFQKNNPSKVIPFDDAIELNLIKPEDQDRLSALF